MWRFNNTKRKEEVVTTKLRKKTLRLKNVNKQRATMVEAYTSGSSLGVIRDMYGFATTSTISGHIWAYHHEVKPLFGRGPGVTGVSGRTEMLPKYYWNALQKFGPVPEALPVEPEEQAVVPEFLSRDEPEGQAVELSVELKELASSFQWLGRAIQSDADRLVAVAQRVEELKSVPEQDDANQKALAGIVAALAELRNAG